MWQVKSKHKVKKLLSSLLLPDPNTDIPRALGRVCHTPGTQLSSSSFLPCRSLICLIHHGELDFKINSPADVQMYG